MKTVVFLAILGIVSAAPNSLQYVSDNDDSIEVRGLIENSINKTINEILANLTENINIDSLPVDLGDNVLLGGDFNITSGTIQGIKELVATDISLDLASLTLSMRFEIEMLLVNFKYWADLLLLELVPLYGEGRMNIVFEDIGISVTGTANITDGVKLSDIKIGISLGEATFDLNGLINNPEFSALVSTALNDNFVTFVNKNSEVISSIISPIVEYIINTVLGGSSTDILNLQAEKLVKLIQESN